MNSGKVLLYKCWLKKREYFGYVSVWELERFWDAVNYDIQVLKWNEIKYINLKPRTWILKWFLT